MKTRSRTMVIFGVVAWIFAGQAGSETADQPNPCAAVKIQGPVSFRNKTLEEIPDIKEPDLRLANALLTARCLSQAQAILQKQQDIPSARYVLARLQWLRSQIGEAEYTLRATIEEFPEFASARVLLAGLLFANNRLPEMERLLDEAERQSPQDLWIYLNRMRLEGLRSPGRELRVRALEITRSQAFPANAREAAADVARTLPHQTPAEFEETLRAKLGIQSANAPCHAFDLAFWLSESEGRFADTRKLLESPEARSGDCMAEPMNRVLLAQAYLMEAASLSPRPAPANQHLLRRADQVLNGDYTALAKHVLSRPQAAKLQPFIEQNVHVEERDEHGSTTLCNAIHQLKPAVVRAELAKGADPESHCFDMFTPIGLLSHSMESEKDDERREILSALLERGAKPTRADLKACEEAGDCDKVLLPLLKQYVR